MFRTGAHIVVILLYCSASFGELYPKSRIKPIQSKSYNGREAKFAIDGDIFSYSTAIGSKNPNPDAWIGVPWWEADLEFLHTVIAVVIIGPPADGHSRGLTAIAIEIMPSSLLTFQWKPGSVYCGSITANYVVPLRGQLIMTCTQYNYGRFVLIRKLGRYGSVSLSEVDIHVSQLNFF